MNHDSGKISHLPSSQNTKKANQAHMQLAANISDFQIDDARALLKQFEASSPINIGQFDKDEFWLAVLDYIDNYRGFKLLQFLEGSASSEEPLFLIHQAFNALHESLQWIYHTEFTGVNKGQSELKSSVRAFLHEAEEYSHFRNCLVMHIAKFSNGKWNKNLKQIELKFKSTVNLSQEAANRTFTELRSPVEPFENLENALKTVLSSSKKQKNGKIQISQNAFSAFRNYLNNIESRAWQFPPNWNLGGYTFEDLRLFCSTLKGISLINVYTDKGRKKSAVPVKKRIHWIREISLRSGLKDNIVETILEDLTFKPELFLKGTDKKTPYILSQPFIALTGERLAISNAAIYFSNIENLTWDLISVLREKVFSQVTQLKEESWRKTLSTFFRSKNLECFGPFDVKIPDRRPTDLDLLVIDRKEKLAVIFELKWLKPHDQLKDVISNRKEFLKGCESCGICLDWSKNVSNLTARIHDKSIDWNEYTFKGIVLSRNSLGDSEVHLNDLPVINQFVLDAIMKPPLNGSLNLLFKYAKNKEYLPREPIHFKSSDMWVSYQGYKLVGRKFKFDNGLRNWNRTTDLKIAVS